MERALLELRLQSFKGSFTRVAGLFEANHLLREPGNVLGILLLLIAEIGNQVGDVSGRAYVSKRFQMPALSSLFSKIPNSIVGKGASEQTAIEYSPL